MSKTIYNIIFIVARWTIAWAIFIGFLYNTDANTWIPKEVVINIMSGGIPISIIIVIISVFNEIKSFIQDKVKS